MSQVHGLAKLSLQELCVSILESATQLAFLCSGDTQEPPLSVRHARRNRPYGFLVLVLEAAVDFLSIGVDEGWLLVQSAVCAKVQVVLMHVCWMPCRGTSATLKSQPPKSRKPNRVHAQLFWHFRNYDKPNWGCSPYSKFGGSFGHENVWREMQTSLPDLELQFSFSRNQRRI